MTDNVAARASTSGELVKFRAPGDFVKLGLAIHHPVTVYTARINQTFTTLDGVAELIYDGGSGTLGNVLINQIIFIGSAAGLYDKGICRVRQLPTATVFYISQTSRIQFADDDYITVVDAMPILQRDITNAGGIISMDYNIEFGNYQNGGAIPRIGPLVSVLKRVAGTVTFTPPSPALSACYDGATIVSYLYAFPGAASTANLTSGTGTASATYDTAGEYRWSCAITDSLGRVTTAYRRLFVDPAAVEFILGDCKGDIDSGDWSYEVTCLSGVARSDVYDRALVTLYEETAYYNGVKGSIGKIAGYENIKCSGWIDGESITYDPEGGEVTFTVRGPRYWFSKLRAFPFELQDTSSAPTSWKEITEMTMDKALAHILFWTSTAPTVMDCFFTGSTIRKKVIVEPGGSLLEQLNAIAVNNIFARVLANNYGQLFIEIDQQLISASDRSALPVVMDITTQDWIGVLDIERNPTPRASMVELGAITAHDGTTSVPVHSRAPGNIGEAFGDMSQYDNYVVLDQAECNRIAGCLLAVENNQYEPLEIPFPTNNPLIDIAPRQYCTISVAVGGTPRGIVLSTVRLIPRSVAFEYDNENFILSTIVTFEFEAIGVDGVTYIPPTVVVDNIDDGFDDPGFGDFPGLDTGFPPDVPPDVTTPCISGIYNAFMFGWNPSFLDGGDPTKLLAKIYFPCVLRSDVGFYSYMELTGTWFVDAKDNYAVYGVLGGTRVITANITHDPTHNWAEFTPLTNQQVDGFELELTAGLGSPVEYVPTDTIASGSVNATNETGVAVATVVDQYYAVDGSGVWESGVGPYFGCTFYEVSQIDNDIIGASTRRIILKATATSHQVTVADNPGQFTDNSGSSTYIVRDVDVRGRRIQLGGCAIHDVCAI